MANYDSYFNDIKYKVKKSRIKLDNGEFVYRFFCKELDISDMLFVERDDKTYEPWVYDYKKHEDGRIEGKKIVQGTIAYDFVQSIHFTERVYISKTKEVKDGNLSILQWYYAIKMVNSAILYKKERWDLEVSRQFGKTHVASRIGGFLPVFAPLYADMPNDRWWQILASYNDDSVKEIFDLKVKPIIFKNIEFFNELYPDSPLVYGKYRSESFVNDKNKLEIRREIQDEAVPHSYVVAISTNTVKDGKSADWMWCDEAWRTNTKEFRRGILPFLSTGGDLLVSGITTSDTDNLMYNIHFEEKRSTPIVCSCFITYNFLLHDYSVRAKNLREMAEEEFEVSGIDSNESQTNYVMTWEVLESGKFYTLDLMKKNKNLSQEPSLGNYNPLAKYRVAGLDLATLNDFCVMTIWDVEEIQKPFIGNRGEKEYQSVWKNTLRDIICYNPDKKPLSAEQVAKDVARDCNTNEIDMIMIDGTAGQRTHNEWIYKSIREIGISTLVCPYDFSGDKNKVILMSNFEQMLRSGLVVLPSERELKTNDDWATLYKEMIKLYKGYENGKKNMQWKAKGKGNTDDYVMGSSLGCMCVPLIDNMERDKDFIRINSYKYRAKLTKFKKVEYVEEKVNIPRRYMMTL